MTDRPRTIADVVSRLAADLSRVRTRSAAMRLTARANADVGRLCNPPDAPPNVAAWMHGCRLVSVLHVRHAPPAD